MFFYFSCTPPPYPSLLILLSFSFFIFAAFLHFFLSFKVPGTDEEHEVDLPGKGLIAANVNLFFDQQLRAHALSTHAPVKQKAENYFLQRNPRIYFNIPIVKFWTSSIFYIAFLVIQAYPLFLFSFSFLSPFFYIYPFVRGLLYHAS